MKIKKPTYSRFAMNRATRLIVAALFEGAEKFTIIRNSAGGASIGVKCGKAYLTAFDFVYAKKMRSVEKTVENAVSSWMLNKRVAAKTCAFLKYHLFGSTNYARAAFYASVISRIVFGNPEDGICEGIKNLAYQGRINFAATRVCELNEYHNYVSSHDYAAAWHRQKARNFRATAEMMNAKAEAHETAAAECSKCE